jgi:hypothetical protein
MLTYSTAKEQSSFGLNGINGARMKVRLMRLRWRS